MDTSQLTDRIRAYLTPLLTPDEQLRWAGQLSSGGALGDIIWNFPWFGTRIWWVGITDKRLIIVAQKRWVGTMIERLTFSVPLDGVEVKGTHERNRRLVVQYRPNHKLPRVLRFGLLRAPDNLDELFRATAAS